MSEFLLSQVLKTFRGFTIIIGTKLLEKTKHEQRKNHLLTISLLLILPQNFTSLSHPLPLCNDNRKQMKKTLTYCFSLHNSTTDSNFSLPPPPPPPASSLSNIDLEGDACRRLFATQKTTLSWGGGVWFACLPVNAPGRVMLLEMLSTSYSSVKRTRTAPSHYFITMVVTFHLTGRENNCTSSNTALLKASKAVTQAVRDIELVFFQCITVLALSSHYFKSCCREGNGLFRDKLSLNEKPICCPSILPLLVTAKVRLSTLATVLTHVAIKKLIEF